MQKKLLFWRKWLIISTCGVLAFGLSMVILPGPTQAMFNYMYLSTPPGMPVFSENAAAYIAFISAVLGAVMFAWSITFLYVLNGPFRRGEKEGWRTLAVSLVAWFIPDTAFSLWSGFWQNAVLNVILATLFAIPLVATYSMFRGAPDRSLQPGRLG